MHIKVLDKPKLHVTKMNCDDGIDDKLNKYELTSFLNEHSCNVFIGKPKSGKTSLINSMFNSKDVLKKVYNKIYLFQPSSSASSIVSNVFLQLPEEQRYDELTCESLEQVYNCISQEPKGNSSAIILDDMTAYLKNKEIMKNFKRLLFNRRHLGVSIYILVQTFFSVPRDLRRVFTNLFVFKVSKDAMEAIFTEVLEIDKKNLHELTHFVYDEKYNFLFVNTDTQSFYKNWDRIIM